MLSIIRDTSNNKDFHALVRLLDDELNSVNGAIQAQYERLNKTENLDTVVIGYQDKNPVGCGCFKMHSKNSIEIKRMFVKKEARGSGIAKMILDELEVRAKQKGFSFSVLETGINQTAALKLYTRLGYKRTDNYGPYIGNPNSICMSKKLT